MDARNRLFAARGPGPNPQSPGPAQNMGRAPNAGYGQSPGYAPSQGFEQARRPVMDRPPAQRPARGPDPMADPRRQGNMNSAPPVVLHVGAIPDRTLQDQHIFGNLCAVSPLDFPPNRDGSDIYVLLRTSHSPHGFVVTARPMPGFPQGYIFLSEPQRTWCGIGKMDTFTGEIYDPFAGGNQAYVGSMDVDIGFASQRKITDTPYDQDALEALFVRTFGNQVMSPGQRIIMDFQNIPLLIVVKTVQLVDLSLEKPVASADAATSPSTRGIVVPQTKISFFKDANSPIKLKGSSKRPAANAIISPDFDFRSLGIGGLDDEFSTIFRRAFASRIFPPGLVEKLGIMHVKGILLYGPPGTGKTLIARKIGGLLNAREPIVVNGPELLNKYVGASEENVRKLFAEAEKEYKAKGDESGLHVIIFDELDAVCKQRGSGAGGGTGVGDSIVNQLLSKLDGVDQLNNIILIGMTNRKDMIDEALLRPGRLEIQVEIGLPDEKGRLQILNIHTNKMAENGVLDSDVDLQELAARTKNFSGAEISGLVKAATSFAFNRHTKVGSMVAIEDVENMKINQGDFMNALNEVKPAYGVAEEELDDVITYGIIDFSPHIKSLVNDGLFYANNVRQLKQLRRLSVLVSGIPGAGKSALAAHIARLADYPFTKLITPQSLTPFRDELGRRDFLYKAFTDAYKSPQSILIIDSVERIIEWNPVGPRLSSPMLQTLLTLLRAPPPKGHRLLILATTSHRLTLEQLDMLDAFDYELTVPAVQDLGELRSILDATGAFEGRPQDMEVALDEVASIGNGRVGVGIKDVITIADSIRSASDRDAVERFVDVMRAKMVRNGTA